MRVWQRFSIRLILSMVISAMGLLTVLLSGSAAYDFFQDSGNC